MIWLVISFPVACRFGSRRLPFLFHTAGRFVQDGWYLHLGRLVVPFQMAGYFISDVLVVSFQTARGFISDVLGRFLLDDWACSFQMAGHFISDVLGRFLSDVCSFLFRRLVCFLSPSFVPGSC